MKYGKKTWDCLVKGAVFLYDPAERKFFTPTQAVKN